MRAERIKELETRVRLLRLRREIKRLPKKRVAPRKPPEDTTDKFLDILRGAKVRVPKTDLTPLEKRVVALEQKPTPKIEIPKVEMPDIDGAILALERRINNRLATGGGNMNRDIVLGGSSLLTRYTDINFIAGSNFGIAAAIDNTLGRTNLTLYSTAVGEAGGGISSIVTDGTLVQTAGPHLSRASIAGDISIPAGSVLATLATVNSNVGTFASATAVPQITVSAKGLVTAASTVGIQIAEGQVTNLVSDLAGKEPTITAGTTAQYWRGDKTFQARDRSLFNYTTNAGNVSTDETDLYTDTIAATTLATNADKLFANSSGSFAGSGTATRQLRAYFAGTLIFDSGALSIAGNSDWRLEITIIRVSNTVVRCSAALNTGGASTSVYTKYTEITTLNLTTTGYVLKTTGTAAGVGAASDDIVARMGFINFVNA